MVEYDQLNYDNEAKQFPVPYKVIYMYIHVLVHDNLRIAVLEKVKQEERRIST